MTRWLWCIVFMVGVALAMLAHDRVPMAVGEIGRAHV